MTLRCAFPLATEPNDLQERKNDIRSILRWREWQFTSSRNQRSFLALIAVNSMATTRAIEYKNALRVKRRYYYDRVYAIRARQSLSRISHNTHTV